ncbi:MAG: recombinase family protein [Spirochaetaceae bacterium]|nr:recombinase family protein [Spirochaetaceae bacterium]
MNAPAHQKVNTGHLRRDAYLYIRQSTVRQVFENTESTRRQYALRQRAVALGWPFERVIVIDSDLGQSGASAADREGFQTLVGEVGTGKAGIVLGLEVSRLARNSSDWHRLLEICALTDTLILDEDGLYNPADFNDRLLLGLKGTMSEAELHVLRARLRGGILNAARRGALRIPLPVGLCYDQTGAVVLDPDAQVRDSIALLFATFARTGSASATVKHFREQHLRFPRRPRGGPRNGELLWETLRLWRVLRVLHNPRYAGIYCFGRTRTRKLVGGRVETRMLPPDQWTVLLPDAHPGYITGAQYEANLRQLRGNAQAHGAERRKSPPREGPALLQGLVICGRCGRRMTVRYHSSDGRQRPVYVCQREGIDTATDPCQVIPGTDLDRAIGELLLRTVSPVTLEVALQVHAELDARIHEADALRRQQVERTRYVADLARRRFMAVDPDNRLVADVLEAEWNEKLRAVQQAQEELELRRQEDHLQLGAEQRDRILALAADFPRLWNDPKTAHRERKRMVRLLIDDVTLTRAAEIAVGIRFRGGATQSMILPLPQRAWQLRQTPPEVVAQIDALRDHHTDGQISHILNQRGYRSGTGRHFHVRIVYGLARSYRLKSRYDRLREAGLLTVQEIAALLGVTVQMANTWRRHGLLRAHAYSDKPEFLYVDPGNDPPVKTQGRKLAKRRRFPEVASQTPQEVQCEA